MTKQVTQTFPNRQSVNVLLWGFSEYTLPGVEHQKEPQGNQSPCWHRNNNSGTRYQPQNYQPQNVQKNGPRKLNLVHQNLQSYGPGVWQSKSGKAKFFERHDELISIEHWGSRFLSEIWINKDRFRRPNRNSRYSNWLITYEFDKVNATISRKEEHLDEYLDEVMEKNVQELRYSQVTTPVIEHIRSMPNISNCWMDVSKVLRLTLIWV